MVISPTKFFDGIYNVLLKNTSDLRGVDGVLVKRKINEVRDLDIRKAVCDLQDVDRQIRFTQ
jgi:hypothetical protein